MSGDDMQRTLIILKPDAVQRRLVGEIIRRFEQKGFQILATKLTTIPEARIRQHYAAHEGKDFYEPLVRYMSDRPLVLMVLQAKNAVAIARRMMGKTFGCDAVPGTIRGDFALSNRFNLIHGSDSPEAANKEIALFFAHDEVHEYPDAMDMWIYDTSTGETV